MKKVKKEYKGQILSNGNVPAFNTNDITQEMIAFYEKQGFAHIFELVEMPTKKENPKKEENSYEKAKKEVKEYSKHAKKK